MKGSYLAHAPRLGSVGLGAVFVCPLVGVLDAGLGFGALLFCAPYAWRKLRTSKVACIPHRVNAN